MSQKKKKGNGYGKGTFIETELFLSKAYINLGKKGTSPVTSQASHNILIMLLGKRSFGYVKNRKGQKKWERTDNNEFTLTYKELESHGISKKSATRGFDELLAKGFISIVDPGGTFEKHKAVYELEDTYQLWKCQEKFENWDNNPVFFKRERDILRGYQGQKKKKNSDPQRPSPTRPPETPTPLVGHDPQRPPPHNHKKEGEINETA